MFEDALWEAEDGVGKPDDMRVAPDPSGEVSISQSVELLKRSTLWRGCLLRCGRLLGMEVYAFRLKSEFDVAGGWRF